MRKGGSPSREKEELSRSRNYPVRSVSWSSEFSFQNMYSEIRTVTLLDFTVTLLVFEILLNHSADHFTRVLHFF